MRWLLAAAITLIVAGLCYHFLYPPVVLERKTLAALEDFQKTVETKDRGKIGEALKTLLTDGAKIHLEVSFFSFTPQTNPPMVQDFDKASFITFIDNILYSLSDYDYYYPKLQSFSLSADHKTAAITFTAKAWGDGLSYYAGEAVNMRFSSDIVCEGEAVFEGGRVLLSNAACNMQLRSVPKPGEAEKIQKNPDAMRQFLR